MKIKLIIADDHCLFRQGLNSLMIEYPEIQIIDEVANGVQLMEALKKHKPDIILLDIKMPEMDGVEATKLIKQQYPDVGIIILTMHHENEFLVHMVELGVNGFLPKDSNFEEIIDAIYSVHDNGYYFSKNATNLLARGLNKRKSEAVNSKLNLPDALNEREVEIIRLICQELTNKEIADKIGLSHRTIDGYRERIIKRLNVKNTAGIVMYAAKNNII